MTQDCKSVALKLPKISLKLPKLSLGKGNVGQFKGYIPCSGNLGRFFASEGGSCHKGFTIIPKQLKVRVIQHCFLWCSKAQTRVPVSMPCSSRTCACMAEVCVNSQLIKREARTSRAAHIVQSRFFSLQFVKQFPRFLA